MNIATQKMVNVSAMEIINKITLKEANNWIEDICHPPITKEVFSEVINNLTVYFLKNPKENTITDLDDSDISYRSFLLSIQSKKGWESFYNIENACYFTVENNTIVKIVFSTDGTNKFKKEIVSADDVEVNLFKAIKILLHGSIDVFGCDNAK
jgi:hypothetical protein|nr:MAG TPA: hypothetical protein [Caudoviricetes sp.]